MAVPLQIPSSAGGYWLRSMFHFGIAATSAIIAATSLAGRVFHVSDVEIETAIIALGRAGGGLVVMPDAFTSVHRAPICSRPPGSRGGEINRSARNDPTLSVCSSGLIWADERSRLLSYGKTKAFSRRSPVHLDHSREGGLGEAVSPTAIRDAAR
jgi:hypothetical protein